MGKFIRITDKEVLAELVRFTQKQGYEGTEGGWKDFLSRHDRKFGASLSDPAKRSEDILAAFLDTFPHELQKYFDKMIRRHNDRKALEQYFKDFPELEFPEQKLVRLTVEHPEYSKNYSFPSYNEGWRAMTIGKVPELMNSRAMVSVDCEMVLCQDGTEAVVRVCAVDRNLEVKLNKLVKPDKSIADYRTNITGISSEDLEGVTCSLIHVQKSLRKLLPEGNILIGHSLFNDLHALKFDYPRVIDTSYIFKCKNLPPGASPSLNNLCKSVLGFAVREEGEPHNCFNDAVAAMKLVLAKLERGSDDPIEVISNNVAEVDLAKLLLHKIPVDVPCQELPSIFPEGPSNFIQHTDLRVRGDLYSTFVNFETSKEADEAFKMLSGLESKDSSGRPQKLVFLKRANGHPLSFFVRKMTANGFLDNCETPKTPAKVENGNEKLEQDHHDGNDFKRQRKCMHPCEHVVEVERLKKELHEREDEIFHLQKILFDLSRNTSMS